MALPIFKINPNGSSAIAEAQVSPPMIMLILDCLMKVTYLAQLKERVIRIKLLLDHILLQGISLKLFSTHLVSLGKLECTISKQAVGVNLLWLVSTS